MTDFASFELRLIDAVSRSSRKIKRSVEGMLGSMGRTGKVAEDADRATRGALGRTVRATRKADKAIVKSGRFRDKKRRLREKDGRFVGGGGKSGGFFGGGGGGGGGLGDHIKGHLISGAIMEMGRLAVATARATGEYITFKQNADLAFSQLTKHDVPGGKLFEHASQLARRYGLDLFDTTKQYQKFLALQFNPKEIDKLTKMGADLRVLGNDAEGVQGIFTALGQIKSKGKMQAEEMLQLAERGISGQLIWEEAGKLLGGKSVDEVRKIQEQGKISSDVGLQAVENAVNRKLNQGKLGEAGAHFADTTISGFVGRMKAFGQDAGLSLVDRLVAPLTKVAGDALTRVGKFLGSADGAATIDRMATSIGQFANRAIELAGVFGPAFGESFSGVWDKLAAGGTAFADAFGSDNAADNVGRIAHALGEVTALAVGFGVAFAATSVAMVEFGGRAWEVGKTIVAGLTEPLMSRIAGIMLWWDEIAGIWNTKSYGIIRKSWEIGKEIVWGIGKGLWSLATWLPEQMMAIVGTAYDAAKQLLGISSPSKLFAELGGYTAEGFALGIDGGSGMVGASTRRMTDEAIYGPATTTFDAGAGGDTISGGSTLTFAPHIEVHGGGGRDADDLAVEIERISRRQMEAFFRELALEHA